MNIGFKRKKCSWKAFYLLLLPLIDFHLTFVWKLEHFSNDDAIQLKLFTLKLFASSIPITLQFYGNKLQRTKHILYTKSKIYESCVDMGSALRPKRCSCKIQTVSQRRKVYLFILMHPLNGPLYSYLGSKTYFTIMFPEAVMQN